MVFLPGWRMYCRMAGGGKNMDEQDYLPLMEEERQSHRDQMRFAAGMSDFIGVVIGFIVILLMVLLILSLVGWLRRDISNTFTLLNTRLR